MTFVAFPMAVGEGTLTEMVAELSPSTGMVLQMPFVCTRKGFASVYEQVRCKSAVGVFLFYLSVSFDKIFYKTLLFILGFLIPLKIVK